MSKEERLEELNEKLDSHGEIESVKDYMKIANSVFGKDRILARQRIINRQIKNNE